jgi:hypothetical protein
VFDERQDDEEEPVQPHEDDDPIPIGTPPGHDFPPMQAPEIDPPPDDE